VQIPLLKKSVSQNGSSGILAPALQCTCKVHPLATTTSAGISSRGMQPSYGSPYSIPSPTDRLLDLRLMHHFVTLTGQTLTTSTFQEPQPLWLPKSHRGPHQRHFVDWVTRLAFRTPSVMDALLGFSAFHLRHLNASDEEIAKASHQYIGRAISAQSYELSRGVSADNAEDLFAASIFIAFTAVGSQRYLVNDQLEAKPPIHWFGPWQGIRAVISAGWQHINTSEIKDMLVQEEQYINEGVGWDEEVSVPIFQFLLDGLDEEGLDEETRFAYESSVDWLSKVYSSPKMRHIFKFTAISTPRFAQLLEQKDPRTLTIVGYFFLLLRRLDGVWWLQGAAEREFNVVLRLLPNHWLPRMEWAINEFERLTD
jgi:hypothetical protein